MSATQAATSAGGRRVGVQVPLVQPHRADVHRVRGVGPAARSPRISSVEPPPMSTTSTGSAGGVAQVAHRTVEGERGLLVARTAPRARRRAARAPRRRRRRRSRRRGWPRWRRSGSAVDVVRPDQRGVLVDRGERPLQRLVGQPAGAVDVLAEPDHPRSRGPSTSGRSPISSLIVLVPQSIAATAQSRRRPRTRRARLPPVAEQVEHLVAERVHAAALGQRLRRPARAGTSPGRACRRRRSRRSRARSPELGRGAAR